MVPEFHGFCDIYYIFTTLQQAWKDGKNKGKLAQQKFYDWVFKEFTDSVQLKFTCPSSISDYLNGVKSFPDDMFTFYDCTENYCALCRNIQDKILKKLPNHAAVVQEIFEALDADTHVIDEKRIQFAQLRKQRFPEDQGYTPPKLDAEGLLNWEAHLLADIILLVIRDPIYLRKGKKDAPILRPGYHIQEDLHLHIAPEPFSPFFGREQELEELKELFQSQNHIFLTGMAGLGKSELAKTYAAQHKSLHQQIFYIFYTGNLKDDIIDMVNTASDFLISVGPSSDANLALLSHRIETPKEDLFRKSIAYLRSLGPKDLIVVDNFDALPIGLPEEESSAFSPDPLIMALLSLRCQLLINTRCSYDQMQLGSCQAYFHVKALDKDSLVKLFCHYYPEGEKRKRLVNSLIKAVFSNTLLVKLIAKLLHDSFLSPEEILKALEKDLTLSGIPDNIACEIDGKLYLQTMNRHLNTMLKLFGVTDHQMKILQYMSLMPLSGVSRDVFQSIAGLQDSKDLQDLIYMGFLQRSRTNRISMHPLLQNVILHKTVPNYINSYPLLENLDQFCVKQLGVKSSVCIEISSIIASLMVRLEFPSSFLPQDQKYTKSYMQFIQDAVPFQYFHSRMESAKNLLDRLDFIRRQTKLFNGTDWLTLFASQSLINNEDFKPSKKNYKSALSILTAAPCLIADFEFLVILLDTFFIIMKEFNKKECKQEAIKNVINTISYHSSSKMVRLLCFPWSIYLGQKELAQDLLALPYREAPDCSAGDLKADLKRQLTLQKENTSPKSLPECKENINN